jgi:hypothetical protein
MQFNQRLTRAVLNPRSREVWRQTAGETESEGVGPPVAVRRFAREARVYWRFAGR